MLLVLFFQFSSSQKHRNVFSPCLFRPPRSTAFILQKNPTCVTFLDGVHRENGIFRQSRFFWVKEVHWLVYSSLSNLSVSSWVHKGLGHIDFAYEDFCHTTYHKSRMFDVVILEEIHRLVEVSNNIRIVWGWQVGYLNRILLFSNSIRSPECSTTTAG